jgi:hypothetical protein
LDLENRRRFWKREYHLISLGGWEIAISTCLCPIKTLMGWNPRYIYPITIPRTFCSHILNAFSCSGAGGIDLMSGAFHYGFQGCTKSRPCNDCFGQFQSGTDAFHSGLGSWNRCNVLYQWEHARRSQAGSGRNIYEKLVKARPSPNPTRV